MSRYCELKLIDVLKEEKREMNKKRSKTSDVRSFPLRSISTKTKLGNLSLLNKKLNSSYFEVNDLSESRKTRLNKKNYPTNSNTKDLRKVNDPKTEMSSGKRKRYDDDNIVVNLEETLNKKICGTGKSHSQPPNKVVKRATQSQKRKRKSRESCWENKLTGARRVSKRLSNLKIEKQKSLRDLGNSADIPFTSIKSKQPIHFSARGIIKASKETPGKSHKRRKSSYSRIHPEAQINFGKLSHTKRLYPKISAGRRPTSYTVTIKSSLPPQQETKVEKDTLDEQFMNEDANDPDVSLLTSKYVEDIQFKVNNETREYKESDPEINTENEKETSIDQLKSSEVPEVSTIEIIPEDEVETLVSTNADGEVVDSTTTTILDIDSGENIKCKTFVENQRNEQNKESARNEEAGEKEAIVKQSNPENPSEDEKIIDFKRGKSEDKSKESKNDGLNKTVEEINTEPESEDKGTTLAESCSEGSIIITETIDITTTAD